MGRKGILVCVFVASCFILKAAAMPPVNDGWNSKSKTEESATAPYSWEFYSTIEKLTPAEGGSNHKFGDEAGVLYGMFMDIYVVREEVVPGDPTRRTVIRKSAIYNAVRSVEKQLSKELKSNAIGKEQACVDFTNVLKVALSAIDSDSESFENELQRNRKDATNLLALFKRVKLIEI